MPVGFGYNHHIHPDIHSYDPWYLLGKKNGNKPFFYKIAIHAVTYVIVYTYYETIMTISYFSVFHNQTTETFI